MMPAKYDEANCLGIQKGDVKNNVYTWGSHICDTNVSVWVKWHNNGGMQIIWGGTEKYAFRIQLGYYRDKKVKYGELQIFTPLKF